MIDILTKVTPKHLIMQAEMLQLEDKGLFVRQLYDYATRTINQKVKVLVAEKTGMSESTFRDKMCGTRSFKEFELDTILSAYAEQLGQGILDFRFRCFITKMSDGDSRMLDRAPIKEISELNAQNEELVTSHFLL